MLFSVGSSPASARAAARWSSDDTVRLEHAVLADTDREWLEPVRRLTVRAVKVPPGFFGSLPSLEWLDVRGGSGTSADFVDACVHLRYLAINQIRGLRDMTQIGDVDSLELLTLYGLPQVRSLPSLTRLERLRRVEVGSMKGIDGLGPLLDAPGLEELILQRAVSLAPSDPARIADHPTLSAFEWFAEDVPDRTWVPVVERVGKPKARAMYPDDWFNARG